MSTPKVTATPTCALAWEIVSSPNPHHVQNVLYAVAVISATDVWAVGSHGGITLTLHWDGSQWTHVPSPNRGTGPNHLLDVTAISSNDVWAVGWAYDPSIERWVTLTEHWNGAQWSIVPSPNQPNSVENYLWGVSAASTNDVWAVGYRSGISSFQTLILHWDGSAWSIVPSPNLGTDNNQFNDVTAISANDAWAAGHYRSGADLVTLVQHWNGSQWEVVPSPNPPGSWNTGLTSIDAVSSNDVWAVGWYSEASGFSGTLIEHWDGQAWSIVPSPNPPLEDSILYGVAAISSSDVWAVGHACCGVVGVPTLTEHWDGTQWSIVPSPNRSTYVNHLRSIAAVSSTDVWAVGDWYDCLGCPEYTLTMHYTPQCPSPTPSPSPPPTTSPSSTLTPTSTSPPSATPSSTPSPTATLSPASTPSMGPSPTSPPVTSTPASTTPTTPTSTATSTAIPTFTVALTSTTPTSTATTCPITFTDVPPEHTFYAEIQCLACRSVLGGYADGTFRPQNNITRGQIAKVVSNAAGFNEPVGGQSFEDVPPSHTFYEWVERLTSRGVMSGYPCGSQGEPCNPPLNRPYFRPHNDATRGQLSKIVSNAANLGGTPTGQHYADVPPTNPFYVEVMRLTNLGVMGGYPCGGVNPQTGEPEPCDEQQRPYFRWANNVTRGQASKIVANTFFPNCQWSQRS